MADKIYSRLRPDSMPSKEYRQKISANQSDRTAITSLAVGALTGGALTLSEYFSYGQVHNLQEMATMFSTFGTISLGAAFTAGIAYDFFKRVFYSENYAEKDMELGVSSADLRKSLPLMKNPKTLEGRIE